MRTPLITVLIVAASCSNERKSDRPTHEAQDTIAKEATVSQKAERVVETINFPTAFFTDIILTADRLVNEIEQASFNKIVLKKNEELVFELYDEDAYDTLERRAVQIKNEVNSKNVLLQRVGETYFLTLFGAWYGCCPRELTVLKIDKTGVKKIFKDSFEVDMIKLSESGQTQYFGYDSFGESIGYVDSLNVELYTYNPIFVYRLGETFELDSAETRKYNEDHYVFAGFDYTDDVVVAKGKGNGKTFLYRNSKD